MIFVVTIIPVGEPAMVAFGLFEQLDDGELSYVSMRSSFMLFEAVSIALMGLIASLISLFELIELAVVIVAGNWQPLAHLAVFICSCSESNKSARNS